MSSTPPPLAADAAAADREWRMLIGGAFAPAAASYETLDPSTGERLASVPDGAAADVDAAVAAAKAAVPAWRATPPRERARVLRELATVLRANQQELAFLDAADGGFPITNMHNDVLWGADLLDLFADWALELGGETLPVSAEHLHYTVREPFGVVGRIIPFNHPIFFAAGKIAAPLMAGNAVVLKPADQTPLSALRMAELFNDLLPAGVLNVVTGDGPGVGRALSAHPDVRRLAFIGSERVGRAIQADAAAAGVKTVTLELGGKNAMIVLPDADLEKAAAGVVAGMNFIGSQGQSCGSNSRVLAHESIEAELVERVTAIVEGLRIGPALDPATQVGPLVSAAQLARVERYVGLGVDEGARLVTGGRRPEGRGGGWYYEPTVFAGVRPEMTIAREEIFGPVLSVMTFSETDEAVRLANDVAYGLTGSVWTRDLALAHRLVRDLEAGYLWINGSSRHFWGVPFGGTKASGVGREECLDELLSFTETKAVHVLLD